MKRNAAVPSSVDLLFMLLAGLIPFVWVRPLLNADGDLARHLRVGETILHDGGLFYRDPFSFTMYGKPFVPYEWLSEVTVALLNRLGGLPAIAIFHGLVIGLTYALVVLFLRRRGVDPLLALLVGVLAAGVSCVHWLARPHIFTPLGAILLLFILEPREGVAGTAQARAQSARRLLWLIPLFALWANLHGGFLYGLILIGVYLTGDLMEALQSRRAAALPARSAPPAGAAARPPSAKRPPSAQPRPPAQPLPPQAAPVRSTRPTQSRPRNAAPRGPATIYHAWPSASPPAPSSSTPSARGSTPTSSAGSASAT